MTTPVKLWDLEAEGGPAEIEMLSLKAKEAVEYDPERYSFSPPAPKREIPHSVPAAHKPKARDKTAAVERN